MVRASWTLEAFQVLLGGKVVPSNNVMPGGVTPVIVLHDLGCVLNEVTTEEGVVVIEVHAQQQPPCARTP